mmetsp:Transcript_11549/g.13263  ORF Transcript_11549/g.13263 Transcript_11549/m.13263 type:complete len:382 (-) Transcript_11549:108-1253(-)
MGAGNGKEASANARVDAALRKAKIKEDSKIKLLLLGAGESGKSTLFKQMKLLYKEKDFTPDQRKQSRQIVHGNIIQDICIVMEACKLKELGADDAKLWENYKTVCDWNKIHHVISASDGDVLKEMWHSPAVQACWMDRSDVQVQDALEYYMQDENIARVATGEEYAPTNQDIIRSRVRTSGVATESFRMGMATFEMYDVGGQRNERKKWIHSFEDVTGVIFVAAISEYDQVLFEDNTVNRQEEAVLLFRKTLCEKWFQKVPFILFLNKKDLFREKLARIPFRIDEGDRKRNTDYEGAVIDPNVKYSIDETDAAFEEIYEDTCDYLQLLYEKQKAYRENPLKIYTYIINSTDTENTGRVMNACKDIILQENLLRGGWYVQGA